jgi:hypothetical protein
MLGRVGALVVLVAALGCGGRPAGEGDLDGGSPRDAGADYWTGFICGTTYPNDCPPGQPCPSFPFGVSGCSAAFFDVPGPGDAGFAWGCEALLSWAAHTDSGTVQASCTCGKKDPAVDGGEWQQQQWKCNYR